MPLTLGRLLLGAMNFAARRAQALPQADPASHRRLSCPIRQRDERTAVAHWPGDATTVNVRDVRDFAARFESPPGWWNWPGGTLLPRD